MRKVKARVTARVTNVALFAALVLVFATGVGAVATGSARGAWIVIGHGIAGILVVLLAPWKTRLVRAGRAQRRPGRFMGYILAALVIAVLFTGFGSGTGIVREIRGTEGLWWHILLALILVPFLLWHMFARPARPRRTDLTRRNLLRGTVVVGSAGAAYAALTATVAVASLPGERRRFTGSHEIASGNPLGMPRTIWLDDTTPRIDTSTWRLSIVDAAGRREHTLAELQRYDTRLRATLDCTSGWYSVQDWTGVPLSELIRDTGSARSIAVRSVTGYWIRFPVRDLPHLLLATRVGDRLLIPGHGYPLRLVAPNRRGYWWVKWVDRVELQDTPWWWQPPFPVT